MADGGFDADAHVRNRRSEENLVGVIVDPITNSMSVFHRFLNQKMWVK